MAQQLFLRALLLTLGIYYLLSPAGDASLANGQVADHHYRALVVWQKVFGGEREFDLLNPELNSVPENLFGVMVDDQGNTWLSDRIRDQLIKLDPRGNTVLAVGQSGEGPEDHRELGPPFHLPDGGIGLLDCSEAPKILCYSENGRFDRSVRLGRFSQFTRVFRGRRHLVGEAIRATRNPTPGTGMEISTFLTLLDEAGTVVDSLVVKRSNLPPPPENGRMNEADFEILPLVAVSPEGLVYVQPDLYAGKIHCFDETLKPRWEIDLGLAPIKRTAEELQRRQEEMTFDFEPARYKHVVRELFPRQGGEIWLEPELPGTSGGDAGERSLRRFGNEGEFLGNVTITGLPWLPGRYQVEGRFIFWVLEPDFELEENPAPGTPEMALFELSSVN